MKMKVGDIIRTITTYGYPVGQFMRVTKIKGNVAYVEGAVSRRNFPVLCAMKKIYTKQILSISKDDYIRLSVAFIGTYYHACNIQFDKLADNPPEIVEFYHKGIDTHLFFRVDYVARKIIKGKPAVRIYFVERLFKDDATSI